MTEKYEISFKFSQDELAHHLMPIKGVIYTLVVENENPETNKKEVTDFLSFYHLPSSILKCKDVPHSYKTLHVAYMYYHSCTKNDIKEMVKFALHYAKDKSIRPDRREPDAD